MAELARDELVEIGELTTKVNALAKRIEQRTVEVAPTLLAMPGVAALAAAKIVGEAAGLARFKPKTALARHAGIAPIPVWSGNQPRPSPAPPVQQPPAQRRGPTPRSPRSASTAPERPTTSRRRQKACRRLKPCAASNAASPASCSTT